MYNVRDTRKEHKIMAKISPMYFDSMVRQTAYRNVFEVCEVVEDLKEYSFYSTIHKRKALVSLEDYNDEATTGAKSLNIPGWNASRSRSSAGSHIRLRPFYAIIGRYQGRLDSEFFGAKLKTTVSVSVTINAGAEKIATPLQVGKTTTSGAIEAGTDIESVSTTINLPKGSNSTMPEHTYTVDYIWKLDNLFRYSNR